MRCIEIQSIPIGEDFLKTINRNMRCIEIAVTLWVDGVTLKINRNMRCIEIQENVLCIGSEYDKP